MFKDSKFAKNAKNFKLIEGLGKGAKIFDMGKSVYDAREQGLGAMVGAVTGSEAFKDSKFGKN